MRSGSTPSKSATSDWERASMYTKEQLEEFAGFQDSQGTRKAHLAETAEMAYTGSSLCQLRSNCPRNCHVRSQSHDRTVTVVVNWSSEVIR
jgi:hypothetical protein